ncbi:iron complex transport system ATP-binding protein [Spinactinospora alkalitolerans]|uniref:Iron complex transport system ATP-binding protein n=1 Tax=Spinactinospora alkalitolerans TaxID=687207 RepID=A0A852U2B5_9ACTN|nr:heme ABC transporter ATP-binding protein [Spinactinospora alkalitolerans]NYE50339.1 iron complex transport system ATP-binding protein [Spinactinospora alkalitolerans]
MSHHTVHPSALAVRGAGYEVDGAKLIADVDLDVAPGEFVGVIGPNGAGKSTLLRTVHRVLRPTAGTVRIDGDDLWALPPRALARRMAAVLQENVAEFDLTVEEVVAMGRSPHKRLFSADNDDDRRLVMTSLELVGAAHLGPRGYPSLSGGEKQRVLLARALTQEPALLVLDEPTNHLDIAHQMEVLSVVRRLGTSVLAVLHDLNLAALYCDRLYVLAEGRVAASGTPAEVLTPGLLADVYHVRADVEVHPLTGAPNVVLLPPE